MATRFGNQYRIGIGIETAYGSGKTNVTSIAFTELTVHSGVIEMTPVVNTATTTHKGLTAFTNPCTEVPATSMGNVVVRGELTTAHAIYLKAIFNDTTDYEFKGDPNDSPISCVLLQLWSDTPSGTSYKVNRAKGAKLISFTITGQSGGLVQYEASFETQPIEREVTQAITGVDPGLPTCGTEFNFGDVTATLACGSAATALDSFSINLVNTLTADGTKFANNKVIAFPTIIEVGGTLSYTCTYDTAGVENDPYAAINVTDEILTDAISLINGANYWQINLTSIATALDVPDLDRDLFKLNYTGKLVPDGASTSVSVTVA